MNKRIYLSPPHMGDLEMKYVQEAFDTNWIAPLGPNVDSFEKEVCEFIKMDHALALSSGTAGIHLALRYLGVGQGDYFFCSDLTFIGSCNPILYQQSTPVFIDSEPASWNMSPTALEKAFEWARKENKMPKAVIVVDLYGQSADYDKIIPICENYGIPIIEDSAEALGAKYHGKQCGNFGYIGVYSFNGNKIITTSGGGMAVSNDPDAIRKMKFWSTQAKENVRHYEHIEYGYNYRMSNISAGIGRGQLQLLNDRIRIKNEIRRQYEERLSDLPLLFMPIPGKSEPNHWLTVVTVEEPSIERDEIINALEVENIESRPVWKPMHKQPLFKESLFFSHDAGAGVGGQIFEKGICLPSGSALTDDEFDRITETIRTSIRQVSMR